MSDPPRTASTKPTLEPTALAALLVAIFLGWCPLTGLAAIVLGGVALHRIKQRPGLRTGSKLAIVAMIMATMIMLVEGVILGELQAQVQDSMEAQALASIEGVMTPIPEEVPAWDARSTEPSAVELADFAKAICAQMGAVKQVSITRRGATGLTEPVISTAFNATCERGTVFGNATFAVVPATLPPMLRLRSVEVEFAGGKAQLPVLAAARVGETHAPAANDAPAAIDRTPAIPVKEVSP